MTGNTNAGSGALIYYLGTGTSFNVSNIPGYQKLTAENFIIDIAGLSVSAGVAGNTMWGVQPGNITPVKTYDATKGILTISNLTAQATTQAQWAFSYSSMLQSNHWISGSGTATITPKVYLVKGNIKRLS